MTLANATLEQLHAWHTDIVNELFRRASVAPTQAQPKAPWETTTINPAAARQPPAMVQPQTATQRLPPGTVLTTARTDPELAARFAQVAMRHEGVPGIVGNGKGEGQIDFNPAG